MRLNRLDTVVFTSNGRPVHGSAIAFDPREGVVLCKVRGKPFRWEGGPGGEYLTVAGNLVLGKQAFSDSIFAVPVKDITDVKPFAGGR